MKNKLLKLVLTVVLISGFWTVETANAAYWPAVLNPQSFRTRKLEKQDDFQRIIFTVVNKTQAGQGELEGLMLVTLGFEPKIFQIAAIPKNMYLAVDNEQYFTVEQIYQWYGLEYTLNLAKACFRLPQANYCVIDLEDGAKIIDQLGGVKINVPRQLINYKSGWQTMSGRELVKYSLLNDPREDRKGWQERQWTIINAVISKVLQPRAILKLPEVVKQLVVASATDLKLTELLRLAVNVGRIGFSGADVRFTPGCYQLIDGKILWALDSEKTIRMINPTIQ